MPEPGYQEADLERVRALAGGVERPEDLRRVLDALGYEEDWRNNYAIKSEPQNVETAKK